MAVQYGPTRENVQIAAELAADKADGIYMFRGVPYRVENHRITHYAYNGRVLELYGHVDTLVGTYEGDVKAARKALKQLG